MGERKKENARELWLSRLLKLFMSMGFFIVSAGGNALGSLFGHESTGRCTTLYYHCVLPEQRSRFAWQMDMLLRQAIPVSVGHQEPLKRGKRYAAITFDDGFVSVAEQAVPELVHRRIPATIFVMSDSLGETPDWKGYPGRFMSVDELRSLPKDLISLGSHTRTHPFLPGLTEEDARGEIALSRVKLGAMLGTDITLFSFPYGAFNEGLITMCREAGYKRVFTTLPYRAQLGPEEFVSGRVRVDPTDWPSEFYLKLRGAYRWLPMAFAVKKRFKAMLSSYEVRSEFPLPQARPTAYNPKSEN